MRVTVSPAFRVAVVLSRVIDETSVGSTVTSQVADLSPALAVIVAEPTFTAVTTPSLTVAMLASDVDHVTVLSVASDGETVAVRVTVSPTFSAAVVLLRDTEVTETWAGSFVHEKVAAIIVQIRANFLKVPFIVVNVSLAPYDSMVKQNKSVEPISYYLEEALQNLDG